MKRENDELILTVKIIGLSKFIDYYGLSIEVEPSSMGQKNVYFSMFSI